MKEPNLVIGVFTYMDDTIKAIKFAKENNFDYKVYSPVPNHELEAETNPKRSPVKYITSLGAVFGLTFGFGLAIWTSLDYPMRVSAKDIVSVPGFVVIGYECTILFGGIFTLLALLLFCKIPSIFKAEGFLPQFSQDKFGVVVNCREDRIEMVKKEMEKLGPDSIEIQKK
jgi:hypothetical protein